MYRSLSTTHSRLDLTNIGTGPIRRIRVSGLKSEINSGKSVRICSELPQNPVMMAKVTGFRRASKRSVGAISLAQSSCRLALRFERASNNGLQPPRAKETNRTPVASNLLAKLPERTGGARISDDNTYASIEA